MKTNTQLIVYGSLRQAVEGHGDVPIQVDLDRPLPLARLLQRYDIPMQRVQLVMVNHRAVSKDSIVCPGDRLSLFPREYPIFADWYDLRMNKEAPLKMYADAT